MNLVSDISSKMMIDETSLLSFASSAPFRYKKYYIAKRNSNEKRLIAHPSKGLKFIQRLVIELLKDKLEPSPIATAYAKGSSISNNVIPHVNNSFLLKMDFKNFFPSISAEFLLSTLEQDGISLSENDKQFLTGIFFFKPRRNSKPRLSIGAPSSPIISNYVLKAFDKKIYEYCIDNGIAVTRYADDLAFSTNKKGILSGVPKVVKAILKDTTSKSVKVNASKTIFTSKARNRHITGITIANNNAMSLGRKRKRYYSSLVHKFTLNQLSELEIEQLIGCLAFAKSIEPLFIVRLGQKYGSDTLGLLRQ